MFYRLAAFTYSKSCLNQKGKIVTETLLASIVDAEEQLRQAMLASDVAALDKLLSPDLMFTTHMGQLVGKQDDLAAHQSGIVKIDALRLSEQRIQLHGATAVVTVRVQLDGRYAEQPINGNFRFTRVWAQSAAGAWQVVAGHSCTVSAA